jgi:3-oxoacyl-[acyl-carrier-protein] synthase-3
MGIEACRRLQKKLEFSLSEIDLVIGASYTPYDTVGTLAHAVQREFQIMDAKVFTVSSACSSFINAMEIVEGYFSSGKSEKALIVASEHNTAYANPKDPQSGHLWGDGAVAVTFTRHRLSETDITVRDIITYGHAYEGQGNKGVMLHPWNGGIEMPFGKDVFIHAIYHMTKRVEELLERNHMNLEELDYLVPHQANIRIIDKVAENLKIGTEHVFINIEEFGNTGCPSSPIALSQNIEKLKKGDKLVLSVFGGGYSSGAALLEV